MIEVGAPFVITGSPGSGPPGTLSVGSCQDPVRDVYVITAADALGAGSRATAAQTNAIVLAIEASALPRDLRFACCTFMTSAVPLS
jgi:hypothetical protein